MPTMLASGASFIRARHMVEGNIMKQNPSAETMFRLKRLEQVLGLDVAPHLSVEARLTRVENAAAARNGGKGD